MGKGKSPIPEELEFVYGLFAQGAHDSDVLAAYWKRQNQGRLGHMPVREDIRFVRQRRKEFEAARRVLEEDFKRRQDPVLAQRRVEHWNELGRIAAMFAAFWEQYALLHPVGGYDGYVIDDPEFEQIDRYMAQCLVFHLQAEFSEFAGVEDWRGLVKISLKTEALSRLVLVARRRTFEGVCPICQSWEGR